MKNLFIGFFTAALLLTATFTFASSNNSQEIASGNSSENQEKVPEGSWTLIQIGFFPGVPGVINYSNVYGIKLGLPMESGYGSVYGLEFALFSGWTDYSYGLKLSPFANISKGAGGVQLSMVNVASEYSAGLQLGVVNVTKASEGFQLGVVNVAKECGVQFGLINVISEGWLPFFPLINFSF